MEKPYKAGIFVARGAPEQLGHMFNRCQLLENVENAIFVLGSANPDADPARNPFTIERRKQGILASNPNLHDTSWVHPETGHTMPPNVHWVEVPDYGNMDKWTTHVHQAVTNLGFDSHDVVVSYHLKDKDRDARYASGTYFEHFIRHLPDAGYRLMPLGTIPQLDTLDASDIRAMTDIRHAAPLYDTAPLIADAQAIADSINAETSRLADSLRVDLKGSAAVPVRLTAERVREMLEGLKAPEFYQTLEGWCRSDAAQLAAIQGEKTTPEVVSIHDIVELRRHQLATGVASVHTLGEAAAKNQALENQ